MRSGVASIAATATSDSAVRFISAPIALPTASEVEAVMLWKLASMLLAVGASDAGMVASAVTTTLPAAKVVRRTQVPLQPAPKSRAITLCGC